MATMKAASHGAVIAISVSGVGARYPLTVDPTWSQLDEFTSSDGGSGDRFGISVAISGSTAIVGAQNHTVGGNAGEGEAYIFSLTGGAWEQTAILKSSDGSAADQFGAAVAISGTTAVVGAPGHMVGGNIRQGEGAGLP